VLLRAPPAEAAGYFRREVDKVKFGIVGLGRMGANLARHALECGHRVVGYDRDPDRTRALGREGIDPAFSLEELAGKIEPPRVVLVYVPHGDPTEEVVRDLRPVLGAGDVVGDGGNSHWADAPRRHAFLGEAGIRFLDIGTSGGIAGARHGACFMVGGDREAYELVAPLLRDLAADPAGVYFAGPSGAGHFVKLVHNAIEFGMVQAIAEGVELLVRSDYPIDLPALFNTWQHGSVIRSWLVELMGRALGQYPDLDALATYVEDTGEVKWVLGWALQRDIPLPVVTAAQTMLMQYRDIECPAAKAVALLRNQYGGHPIHRKKPQP
jgi:6-phosphogluconate dehydrogenase